jgi:hypothetical protein
MVDVVGWDLDSSVASTLHRRTLIPEIRAGRKTWHDYSLLCLEDEPIEGAVALMRLMVVTCPRIAHVAISGRSAQARDLTEAWAEKHEVPFGRYMLRPDDQPNEGWKVQCIRQLQDEGHTVALFVEDWAPAARYIREQTGVPVLGVNPFDPETCLVSRAQLAMELASHKAYANADWVEPEELAADIFARLAGEHA